MPKFFLKAVLNEWWICKYILTLLKEIKDWHLTIAIVIMVAIIVVIVAFGFIIPGVRPTAHLISDGEHPPMENVSDMLRLTLQKAIKQHISKLLLWYIGVSVNMLSKCVKLKWHKMLALTGFVM